MVDNIHIRMELIKSLEPLIVLRNQQVAGSIPAGGSNKIKDLSGSSRKTGGATGGTYWYSGVRPVSRSRSSNYGDA